MSQHKGDRDPLAPEDASFVRFVADAYAPAPLTPARRAAFDLELETRLARDRWRFAPWAAALVVAGAAAALVLALVPNAPVSPLAVRSADAGSDEDYVIALGDGSVDDFESTLPTDYQAIASLLELE